VSLKRITVAETPLFVRQAAEVWSDDQRESFVDFIAKNPQMGMLSRIPAESGKFDGRKPELASAAACE
jgi:hypothetical protein